MKETIATTTEAGNSTDVEVFVMPAGFTGFISKVSATNDSGGVITLTLKVKRNGVTYNLVTEDSIADADNGFYGHGSLKCICPLTMNASDSFIANASDTDVFVDIAGLRFSI